MDDYIWQLVFLAHLEEVKAGLQVQVQAITPTHYVALATSLNKLWVPFLRVK